MGIYEYLRSHRVPFELMLHTPSPCATRMAHSLHVPGQRVAKSVLVSAASGFVLAVLPATHRVDLARLGEALGLAGLRLATERELEEVFLDCERGATPPFGHLYGLTTVADPALGGGAEIIVEGNLRHVAIRLKYRDFEALEMPVKARFATAMSPGSRRFDHRKAG